MTQQADLADFLGAQLALQTEHMADGDPRLLREADPEAWAVFMRWNAFALEDEIHEAMQEVGWKPWATSRHLNRDEFMKEMVDAWHFFMNMLLAASPGMAVSDIAQEFAGLYWAKNQINAERQEEGYTGTDKCPGCGRDLNDTKRTMAPQRDVSGREWCSRGCHMQKYPDLYDEKGQPIGS